MSAVKGSTATTENSGLPRQEGSHPSFGEEEGRRILMDPASFHCRDIVSLAPPDI